MSMFKAKLFTILSAGLLVGAVQAGTTNLISPVLPNSVTWVDVKTMPAGAKAAILSGNPTKKEPFIALIKLPAGYEVPVHSHAIDEHDTVLSGEYFLGTGNTVNIDQAIKLPVGSYVKIPAKTLHFGLAKEETVLQVSGVGPWGMIYPEKHSS